MKRNASKPAAADMIRNAGLIVTVTGTGFAFVRDAATDKHLFTTTLTGWGLGGVGDGTDRRLTREEADRIIARARR